MSLDTLFNPPRRGRDFPAPFPTTAPKEIRYIRQG